MFVCHGLMVRFVRHAEPGTGCQVLSCCLRDCPDAGHPSLCQSRRAPRAPRSPPGCDWEIDCMTPTMSSAMSPSICTRITRPRPRPAAIATRCLLADETLSLLSRACSFLLPVCFSYGVSSPFRLNRDPRLLAVPVPAQRLKHPGRLSL